VHAAMVPGENRRQCIAPFSWKGVPNESHTNNRSPRLGSIRSYFSLAAGNCRYYRLVHGRTAMDTCLARLFGGAPDRIAGSVGLHRPRACPTCKVLPQGAEP